MFSTFVGLGRFINCQRPGNFPAHDGPGSCDQPNQPKLIYIIIILEK